MTAKPKSGDADDETPTWLPAEVYNVLPEMAKKGIAQMRKDMAKKDAMIEQTLAIAKSNALHVPANGSETGYANGNGNGNGNGHGRTPGKFDQYQDADLAGAIGNAFGLLTQSIPAMQQALASGDPAQIEKAQRALSEINPQTISAVLSEYVDRRVTSATSALRKEQAASQQSASLGSRVVRDINGLFGADGFQQDHPITERANELMGQALQFLGKRSMEELSETEKALVTRNAYTQAASDINHGGGAPRAGFRDTTESPGSGAGTSGRDMVPDEVSALLDQGKKGEAQLLAASRLFAGRGGGVDPRIAVSPYGGRMPQPGR